MESDVRSVREIENVVKALVSHGWVWEFRCCPDEGYAVQWTEKGKQRRILVQHLIQHLDLTSDPEKVVTFTRDCQDKDAAKIDGLKSAEQQFWVACIEELGLRQNPESLWVFVKIMSKADACNSN